MLTIKKISRLFTLSLALISTTTTFIEPKSPMSAGKGCVILAGAILGYLGGHYGTAYQIKRSHSDTLNPIGASKIDNIAPIMGGIAGAILGGIIAHEYWNMLNPPKRSHTSNSPEEDESPTTDNNKYKADKSKEDIVKVSDIIGLDSVVSDIKEIINQIKNPAHYKKFGVKLPKGVLLEGPPGTGKTMIAKALAHETGCSFFYASASSFDTEYVGSGAKNIRALFNNARKAKSAIIFIDELDAIGSRHRKNGHDNSQTINELLTQMDGFVGLENVLIFAATNHKDALDEALIRPGRFDRLIKVPLPDYTGRYALAQHLQKTKPHINVSDAWLKKLAQETQGLGAGDIKNVFNMAALQAAKENASQVEERYLQAALQTVLSERKK